jgi:hypothetical protein
MRDMLMDITCTNIDYMTSCNRVRGAGSGTRAPPYSLTSRLGGDACPLWTSAFPRRTEKCGLGEALDLFPIREIRDGPGKALVAVSARPAPGLCLQKHRLLGVELTRFRTWCWGQSKKDVPDAKNPSTIRVGIAAPNHRAGARSIDERNPASRPRPHRLSEMRQHFRIDRVGFSQALARSGEVAHHPRIQFSMSR